MRANLGAMSLIGGWFGFQFSATLYIQELRGWSPLETGLAIFPGGMIVALLAPRIAPIVARFGVTLLILTGLTSAAVGYALFLPIGLDSAYVVTMLLTFVLGGLGFALAYGPLNIAATNGIVPEEQGLAGGLVNTSFQFGGALVLAIATAVSNATVSTDGSEQGRLDGFHTAIIASLVVALLGAGVTAFGIRKGAARTTMAHSGLRLALEAPLGNRLDDTFPLLQDDPERENPERAARAKGAPIAPAPSLPWPRRARCRDGWNHGDLARD